MNNDVYRFFSCVCGLQFNKFVKPNTAGLFPTAVAGVSKVVIGQTSVEETDCPSCGKTVASTFDPKGKPTSLQFNYMED